VSKKTGNKVLKTTKEKDSHVGADKSYTDVVLEQTLVIYGSAQDAGLI